MKIIILIITLITSPIILAEYTVKVHLEQSQGGSLSNGSIKITSGSPVSGEGSESGQCYGYVNQFYMITEDESDSFFQGRMSEFDSNVVDFANAVFYEDMTAADGSSFNYMFSPTHRYSIGTLVDTNNWTEFNEHHLQNVTYTSVQSQICKEEIIGSNFGPKICCEYFINSSR